MPLAFTRQVSPRIVECALTHLDRRRSIRTSPPRSMPPTSRRWAMPASTSSACPILPTIPTRCSSRTRPSCSATMRSSPGPARRRARTRSIRPPKGSKPHFTVHHLCDRDARRRRRAADREYALCRPVEPDRCRWHPGTGRRSSSPLGYRVVPVELGRCLHLKTAVTFAGLDRDGVPTLLGQSGLGRSRRCSRERSRAGRRG